MFEYAMHDRNCRHDERRGRWHREEQRQLNSAILCIGSCFAIRSSNLPRKRWQNSCANSNADQAKWQLVQSVGIIEPRYRPFG